MGAARFAATGAAAIGVARLAATGAAAIGIAAIVIGCDPGENAILISARTQADLDTLSITVVRVDGGSNIYRSGDRPIHRSRDDIAAGPPVRVAIDLDGPSEVMVHLVGRSSDGTVVIATRCYRVSGVVTDEVLLGILAPGVDGDGDGYPTDPLVACLDPDGDGSQPCKNAYRCPPETAADCAGCPTCTADADETIYPGAPEICADGIDQNCDGTDSECRDGDGDGSRSCSGSDAPGTCDCDDESPSTHPLAADTCGDGIDQDCDGFDAKCDGDGDGYVAERDVGGTPDCDDTDPAIHPGADELCDEKDNDCNGLTDELPECTPDDLDRDGYPSCSVVTDGTPCDCNDCDPGIGPGVRDLCGNGLDEDCSGDDLACPAGDLDGDGVAGTATGGTDCDDADPRVYPGAPERCGNGISESCTVDRDCSADTDGDGFVETEACELPDDGSPDFVAITPWLADGCDGVDNDCDGTADEVLSPPSATYPNGNSGCITGGPGCAGTCSIDFATSLNHCGGCRMTCNGAGTLQADLCADGQCQCSTEPGNAACSVGQTCCNAPTAPNGVGCRDLAADPQNCGGCGNVCTADAPDCVAGRCTCSGADPCGRTADDAAQMMCCGGTCSDPRDDATCGTCTNSCTTNSSCVGSSCTCDASFANCAGPSQNQCPTNTTSDLDHCGGCNMPCRRPNASARCTAGGCTIGGCNAGFATCDGNDGNGCEIDTRSDPRHCGGCGIVCGAGETCSMGRCACAGTQGTMGGGEVCTGARGTCCPSVGCVDDSVDNGNCGGCGILCGPSETCSAGRCGCNGTRGTVGGGEVCTGSTGTCCPTSGCTDTSANPAHCGGCGVVCGPSETCSAGRCGCNATRGTVGGGEVCVGGTGTCCPATGCVNTNLHESHCGACDAACGTSETCMAGRCNCSGTTGTVGGGEVCTAGADTCCPGIGCADTSSDVSNCGGCGIACGSGETCAAGRCTCAGTMGTVGGGDACTGPAGTCCPSTGCVNTNLDESHCGACDTACGGSETCSGGQCTCGPDSGAAGGGAVCVDLTNTCCPSSGCVDTTNDALHCGMCDNPCANCCVGSMCRMPGMCP